MVDSAPTGLVAVQNRLAKVIVSWTTPSVRPSEGYRITAEPGGVSAVAQSSPHNVTNLQPGVYDIRVMSLSQWHLPSEAVGPVEVTVRGENRTSALRLLVTENTFRGPMLN